ncbi:hypothetical protein [Aquidulcibacter sp.]|uniref:hypothetical protein n=1 Tax=Aquidulcibacter sp. TaxID=2052990 RepID=UPI0025B9D8A1|nr:hypothetical protein [Aquidulcibacter sp.]MCA3691729.1 hypothetical protein [Aquidulcibacter sp.]
MKSLTALLLTATLALSACGQAPTEAAETVKELKSSAVSVAGDAAKAVGEVLDTKLVCQLAGQSESFCGCLQTELGPKLKAEHIDAVTAIVKTSIDGSIQSAVETATSLDPKTRNGLVSCAAKAAISDAISGQ